MTDDPDTEIAKRHFGKGSEYYNAQDYLHALEEFQAARRVLPLPALDYNIGRCFDRLEHWQEAIVAYDRYVHAGPQPSADVIDRLRALRARVAEDAAAQNARAEVVRAAEARERAVRLRPRWFAIPAAVAGATLVAALGAGIAAKHDRDELAQRCVDFACAPGDRGLLDRSRGLLVATEALLGVGGAAAVVAMGVGLYEHRRAKRAWALAPILWSRELGFSLRMELP